MRRFAVPATVLLLAGALPARSEDAIPTDTYARVNAALVENHVLPRYGRLAVAAAQLAQTAKQYCADRDAAGLDRVRTRFHEAMDAWMGVQHLRFGPSELFMRAPRLSFWPEARGKVGHAVDSLLAEGNDRSWTPERTRNSSVAAQGLPAVEYLLFDAEATTGEARMRGARCALLEAVTANIQAIAAGIVADWQTGENAFARTVIEPGPDNPHFETDRDATLAFFKSLHGGLQLIADVKLRPVAGETAASARPRFAESRRSGRSLRNVALNLEALKALYLGEGGPGLSALTAPAAADSKLDPLLRRAFPMTMESAQSIDDPLAKAVTDPANRPALNELVTRVRALEQLVRTRLAAALGLSVGFNALDGD